VVLKLPKVDGEVKRSDSPTRSVIPALPAVILDCSTKLLVFSHWSVINKKKQINSHSTARYFNDTTVANKNMATLTRTPVQK
jgi:hypothetical protein